MGVVASKLADDVKTAVNTEVKGQEDEITQMMQVLNNKKESMENQLLLTRGQAKGLRETEVCGGRTVMRVSEVYVCSDENIAEGIKSAIKDFFTSAQGAISGDKGKAQHSAIAGAQELLGAGIEALMGVSKGQSMEKKAFVVLFMNNAFVRCDYHVYTYSVSASKWGKEKHKAGAVYVTDLAVLALADLNPSEIDFLVSQALSIDSGDFHKLLQLKASLVQVSILSRMMQKPDVTFDDVNKIFGQLAQSQAEMAKIFDSFTVPNELKTSTVTAAATAVPNASTGSK